MIPQPRLGFFLRKWLFDLLGLDVPTEIDSPTFAAAFYTTLADSDVGFVTRSDTLAVLAYAQAAHAATGTSDPALEAHFSQMDSDLGATSSP